MDLRRWFSASLLTLAGCNAFDGGQACTAIGCLDSVHFTVRVPDNLWPSGSYRLEFKTGDATHVCEITLPRDLPESERLSAVLSCGRELRGYFTAVRDCADPGSAPKGQPCGVLPDQWFIDGYLEGAPAAIHVRVERDGMELLDEDRALTYREFEPNGPECGPTCRSSGMALELSP